MNMEITFPGGARVDAAFEGFVVRTDQSPDGGGEGSAPAPFSLFLASIATCTGIYVLNFCRHRNIPMDDIHIQQSLERDPETRMVRQINLDIDLPAGFPQRYVPALIRSAKLCAVKKHLENPPSFDIQTHFSGGGR